MVAIDERVSQAKTLVKNLADGKFETVFACFDDNMKAALPVDKLQEVWSALVAMHGQLTEELGVKLEVEGLFDVAYVTCRFSENTFDFKVVYDKADRVTGLFVVPRWIGWQAPDYVDTNAFDEVDVSVGSEPYILSGTLSKPKNAFLAPAVVLVHGSGPQDRDETVGKNKPFKDLAWGLASRGIAVLRYEKRTAQYASSVLDQKPFTVQHESVDDALAALALLRKTDGINHNKTFVVGHSLGALVAPLIAEQDTQLSGMVLLAGNSRPLEDVIIEQCDYLIELAGPNVGELSQVLQLRAGAEMVKDESLLSELSADQILNGAPVSYWKHLKKYDAAMTAKHLITPMLVCHAGRDYQISAKDFTGWKNGLGTRANVKFKEYPTLNHLFAEGEGKSHPGEYMEEKHVSVEVVDDIANWIKSII